MTNDRLKVGDRVRIIYGPENMLGRTAEVTALAVNGALIRFSNGSGTIVKFEHLEKIIA